MHNIPKNLTGNERLFTIPYFNVHINKIGAVYNSIATILSLVTYQFVNLFFLENGRQGNILIGGVILLILNIVAYPLGHMRIPRKKMDGGDLRLDKWLLRKYKYTVFKGNLYIRLANKKNVEKSKMETAIENLTKK